MTDNPKPLPFSLRWLEELVQENEIDCLPLGEQFYFPDDTTDVTLVWSINQNDFIDVLSALNVGADIAFPTTAQNVVMKFLKMVCANMEICTEVANCLTNDTGTQDALAALIASNTTIQSAISQYINDSGGNNGAGYPFAPLSPSIMASNVIPGTALCTDANKYAMARAIVQQLDKLATDFLEIVALAASQAEIAADIVSNIPIFGGLASTAIDVAVWIDTYVKTAYAAAYNSTTETDYSCAVYCAFSACELSWDNVIAVYEDQASLTPPNTDDFATIMLWFVNNVIPSGDNLIVGCMHLFILNSLKWGSSFMGSGVWTALEIAVEDAADEEITVPGSCACPSDMTAEWDFTVGSGGWIQQEGGGRGVYSSGVGWVSELNGTQGLIIYHPLPTNCFISEVSFDYEFDAGSWAISAILRNNQNSSSGQVTIISSSGITASPNCGNGSVTAAHRSYLVVALNDGSSPSIQGKVTAVRIKYTGDDPTGITSTGGGSGCP